LAICAVLSRLGGWWELARRFKNADDIDGERFRFRSGSLGWGVFPVNYGSCLFATVGRGGFSLSILFPFRFMHPPLLIPWSAVERCEQVRFWFVRHTAVHVTGFGRRLLFMGGLGRAILAAWTDARRRT
jgi:hypothetical protein